MAEQTAYTDLLPRGYVYLRGCPREILLQSFQAAGRQFCEDSQAWREQLDPAQAINYKRDYRLVVPHSATAQIHRLVNVKVNSATYDPKSYTLFEGKFLRFKPECIPNDLDERLLVCATAGSAVIAVWNAITDGSATFTLDDDTYLVDEIDFSDCTSMDDVALEIQTALRVHLDDNRGFVQWVNDHFVVWVEDGTIGVLTAGTIGTDISGASYMNGLTSAGVLSGLLEVEAVIRPDVLADTMPDWFFDRYSDAVLWLGIHLAAGMPAKPWSDPTLAAKAWSNYAGKWTDAAMDKRLKFREYEDTFTA